MNNTARPQLVFHGSIILLVALVCGLPSVVEVSGGTSRMWQAAHSALLVMGAWMFAQAGVLGVLVLKRLEMTVVTWALIATAYSLAFAAIVQAATGVRTHPHGRQERNERCAPGNRVDAGRRHLRLT